MRRNCKRALEKRRYKNPSRDPETVLAFLPLAVYE